MGPRLELLSALQISPKSSVSLLDLWKAYGLAHPTGSLYRAEIQDELYAMEKEGLVILAQGGEGHLVALTEMGRLVYGMLRG